MEELIQSIQARGGDALFVGGAVRDRLLGRKSKDIDIEVYGLDADTLCRVLQQHGRVDAVGKSFGVLKLSCSDGQEIDVSLPRRENKAGQGHRGFMMEPDPTMSPQEAACRRDFTFNSLAMRADGEVLDFCGGVQDLRRGVLRHVSLKFAEDPLRVLRGMQFAGRFNLRSAPETTDLCRRLRHEYQALPVERIWGEFYKLAAKASVPSAGLRFLEDSAWVEHFPELLALRGCPQDPGCHPEGDVWEHTLHTADAAAKVADRQNLSQDDRAALVLAAICHDMGKPDCTQKSESGRWVSPGHNDPSRAVSFLTRIGCPKKFAHRIQVMVREHMAHLNSMSDKGVRRLLHRISGVASLDDVIHLIEADHSARPFFGGLRLPTGARNIRDRADQLGRDQAITPVLKGRDLLDLGYQQGPQIGRLLRQAHQAQMDGLVSSKSEALAFLGLT